MKLYTEEQVRGAYNKGHTDWINEIEDNNILYTLIPIELPSDEEILKEAFKVIPKLITDPYEPFYDSNEDDRIIFINGAKWMKEQILNQNK